jgi:glycyl-tRNA synthetase beta chain
MVGEFPELQGTMGRYYASADSEPADVAAAIEEHYLPRGAGGALPQTAVGTAVALADKLDTLAGIFAIGQKPTGTKDPFGLRRAAIGLLRILVEKKLDVDLRGLIGRAVALQPVASATAAADVAAFVTERLRAYYLESAVVTGATTEMFDAVEATTPVSPLDFGARLAALAAFLKLPEAVSLTAANKRIANILKKSDVAGASAVDASALALPAEQALHRALSAVHEPVTDALSRGDYTGALTQLAKLRAEVDAFFDGVMVNDPDPRLRANRLALLADLRKLFSGVADLSVLPG